MTATDAWCHGRHVRDAGRVKKPGFGEVRVASVVLTAPALWLSYVGWMRRTMTSLVLVSAIALAACSAPTPSRPPSAATSAPPASTQAPANPTDATAWARQVSIDSTTKVVTVTEDNDPNNLIGRPNGYVSAAVLYDSGVECAELGTSCGGMVEVWPTAADAQRRSDYIQGILKDSPVLGTEYDTLNGAALLRIDGKVTPSVANSYAAKFKG